MGPRFPAYLLLDKVKQSDGSQRHHHAEHGENTDRADVMESATPAPVSVLQDKGHYLAQNLPQESAGDNLKLCIQNGTLGCTEMAHAALDDAKL